VRMEWLRASDNFPACWASSAIDCVKKLHFWDACRPLAASRFRRQGAN
jgi:hypothetical protein